MSGSLAPRSPGREHSVQSGPDLLTVPHEQLNTSAERVCFGLAAIIDSLIMILSLSGGKEKNESHSFFSLMNMM